MILRLSIIFLISLILSGCSKENSTEPGDEQASDKISDAEYSVLHALIDSLYYTPADSQLVLWDSTTTGIYSVNLDSALTIILQRVHNHINVLSTETMQDFKSKNQTPIEIQNPTGVHPACVFREQANHRGAPSIEVSRVGFSSDGKQAVAYVGRMDAPLHGHGYYNVLSKENGKWIVVGVVLIWIA